MKEEERYAMAYGYAMKNEEDEGGRRCKMDWIVDTTLYYV